MKRGGLLPKVVVSTPEIRSRRSIGDAGVAMVVGGGGGGGGTPTGTAASFPPPTCRSTPDAPHTEVPLPSRPSLSSSSLLPVSAASMSSTAMGTPRRQVEGVGAAPARRLGVR